MSDRTNELDHKDPGSMPAVKSISDLGSGALESKSYAEQTTVGKPDQSPGMKGSTMKTKLAQIKAMTAYKSSKTDHISNT